MVNDKWSSYLSLCKNGSNEPPNPLSRHPERSEGPLFEGLLDDQQRSFAALRMTGVEIFGVVETASAK